MEHGELNCNSGLGTLTVNSVLLNTVWVCAYDLSALLDEADMRGSDRLIPSLAGVIPNRRRRTVTRKDIPLAVTGLYNRNGVRQADCRQGLIDNVRHLRNSLGFASTGGDGTVTATWTQPDATAHTASVTLLGLRMGSERLYRRTQAVATAVLSMSVPVGVFT